MTADYQLWLSFVFFAANSCQASYSQYGWSQIAWKGLSNQFFEVWRARVLHVALTFADVWIQKLIFLRMQACW